MDLLTSTSYVQDVYFIYPDRSIKTNGKVKVVYVGNGNTVSNVHNDNDGSTNVVSENDNPVSMVANVGIEQGKVFPLDYLFPSI